ncbi:lipoprotein-anchoring transpeptidase ErfK/SrfK [Spirilliplanes yamanashiensis]|nr:lipoprotein-anchoring transpeptidase ErfK/SrfK [Spirilliplanes yamanashiensis]
MIGIGGVGYALDAPAMIVAAAGDSTATPGTAGGTDASAPEGRSFVVVAGPKKPSKRTATDRSGGPRSVAERSTPVRPCAPSRRQRDVERSLSTLPDYSAVVVDGKQSPGDCAVIRRFQQRFGIQPAAGQSDDTTAGVAGRIATSSTPDEQEKCAAGDGVTACVDLTQQTAWVVRDGKVVVGPTVVRTGFRGYATPAGTYRINKRDLREWSDPYEVWLPYWQRFVGGIGFHATTTYIHDATLGSHGCVNLLHADAVAMWDALQLGATVHTFGRRPGT